MLRRVHISDAQAILDIYKIYLPTRVTMQTNTPTLEEYQELINKTLVDYPFVVYTIQDKIVGYAYAHRFRERGGYDKSVETSIYVHPDYIGKKIGTALYSRLKYELKKQGFYKAYAYVLCPNISSEKLHYRVGFNLLVKIKDFGYKNNQFVDGLFFELDLRDE